MGADSFIRRASGLLVPKMSFAAPWLWLPCEDCDCDSSCSLDDHFACFNGTPPTDITATVAGMANDDCGGCTALDTSYTLTDWPSAINPRWKIPVTVPCAGDYGEDSNEGYLSAAIACSGVDYKCRLAGGFVFDAIYNTGHPDDSSIYIVRETHLFGMSVPGGVQPDTEYILPATAILQNCWNLSTWAPCTLNPQRCDNTSATHTVDFTAV